jgi:uncharacterized protein with HEPN domain
MRKDPRIFIEHILECIKLIEGYLNGKTKDDFLKSTQLQDAVIRRIEIIGEAVRNIPSDLRVNYPDVPWNEMVGMRDILIHKYFGIDLELTWEVAIRDIPALKERFFQIKKDIK